MQAETLNVFVTKKKNSYFPNKLYVLKYNKASFNFIPKIHNIFTNRINTLLTNNLLPGV